MKHPFYITSFAYTGDTCSWGDALEEFCGGAIEDKTLFPDYETRRLDKMVACSIEAVQKAGMRSGYSAEMLSDSAIVSVSHNGPCIYSEDFFHELMDESNPQLVSPMLFTESVLNITATHLSMILGSHRPTYSLNIDLSDFLTIFNTIHLLMDDRQCSHGALCVCEEFSSLPGTIFTTCSAFPGKHYIDGAIVLFFSKEKPNKHDAVQCMYNTAATETDFLKQMKALAASGITCAVNSRYSTTENPLLLDMFCMADSFLPDRAFNREQAFTVSRMAELLGCHVMGLTQQGVVVVQQNNESYQWVTLCQA